VISSSILKEPWFQPKPSGLGLIPITWQGACVTVLILVILIVTVAVIVAVVRNPAEAVLAILVTTGAELAVLILWTYRHAKRAGE
jgi:hypothetical protein